MSRRFIISLLVVLLFICVCVGMGIAAFFITSSITEVAQEESAPLNVVPTQRTAVPPPTRVTKVAGQIPDLAYIKLLHWYYSDDADAESEGIAIDIQFYNSKSKPVQFSNIPLEVTIRLYAFRKPWGPFKETEEGELVEEEGELVYEGSLVVDHSMRLGEMFGNYIRIPYDEIHVDQELYDPFGRLTVTVKTPLQGEFSASSDYVLLVK